MDLIETLQSVGLPVIVIDEHTFLIPPEQDIELIACLTENELYNGSSYHRACKPTQPSPIHPDAGTPWAAPSFTEDANFSGRFMS